MYHNWIVLCWWTFDLFPVWGYYKYSFYLHTLGLFCGHIQTDLIDTVDFFLNHCNKANCEIKQVTHIFGFPVHRSCVYTIPKSIKHAIMLCLIKSCKYLIKIPLLLKNANHYLSLQWVEVFLLVKTIASVLMATRLSVWLLLKSGECCHFLKQHSSEFCIL